MTTDRWPAPAKLNLFLYITGRRGDGYHQLQTLFQFLDYGDTLTLDVSESGSVTLLTPVDGVTTEDNLVVRAATLIKQTAIARGWLTPQAGVAISLEKRLPMGGGLGGGSSDAATVLVALNKLWRLHFTPDELAALGLTLGADVPVFVHGHAAYAEGIGDILTPAYPAEKWYLVVHPGVLVSTPLVFNDNTLQRDTPPKTLDQRLAEEYHNDCEPVVRKRFREVDVLVSWLLEYAPSRLTGTGACVFAEFDTECAARQVLARVPDKWQGFVAQGVNISPLHRRLPETFKSQ